MGSVSDSDSSGCLLAYFDYLLCWKCLELDQSMTFLSMVMSVANVVEPTRKAPETGLRRSQPRYLRLPNLRLAISDAKGRTQAHQFPHRLNIGTVFNQARSRSETSITGRQRTQRPSQG